MQSEMEVDSAAVLPRPTEEENLSEKLSQELLQLLEHRLDCTEEEQNLIASLTAYLRKQQLIRMQMPAVMLKNLAGETVLEVRPVPYNVAELKQAIEREIGIHYALQRLVRDGCIYEDDDEKLPNVSLEIMLLMNEVPLYSWDIDGNPDWDQIVGEGSTVRAPKLRSDYVNVVTQEPMRSGVHYIEFVMHKIGDEQWCGVVTDKSQAGRKVGGRSLNAWTYYCGRQGQTGSIHDGKAALHVGPRPPLRRAVKEFEKPHGEGGDVLGMLVDLNQGAVAFDLNGRLQGACPVPKQPLYILTHLDTPDDRVELRKPSLQEVPPANLEALKGALLDVASGEELHC